MARRTDEAGRVLVFAPIGRDAELTRELLARVSIDAEICRTIDAVTTALGEGVAALIATEELFEQEGASRIAAALRAQPPWSDIAVLLFAGSEGQTALSRTIEALEWFPNVTLLERPIRVTVAVSIVRSAIRARRRQLEVRDLLIQLEAAREQAETASRTKDEFLATLSHELRTPLNAILGWTAMLKHGPIDPSRLHRGLDVIDRNARSQAQLVEDVLDMARVITGKLRIELKPVSVTGVVDLAIEAMRPAADAKRISLVLERRTEIPLIHGDTARLQQILWNLISNAVKFTPEGGNISIRVELRGAHVRISISDSGVGIDPQFLPFVFDRFRQADQSVTRAHSGLGLGLAIVKHLVELHGGQVSVNSAGLGKGSTFDIDFPVPAVLLPGTSADARSIDPFTLRLPGRRILVVDDDAATRELLGELFDRAEAVVTTADSAAAAFAAVQRDKPHVIISDIGLPGEDGCSLMRRIRALPPPAGNVPSIALSAYTRSEDLEGARASGFTHFIGKPAPPGDLLVAVNRLLASMPVEQRPPDQTP